MTAFIHNLLLLNGNKTDEQKDVVNIEYCKTPHKVILSMDGFTKNMQFLINSLSIIKLVAEILIIRLCNPAQELVSSIVTMQLHWDENATEPYIKQQALPEQILTKFYNT